MTLGKGAKGITSILNLEETKKTFEMQGAETDLLGAAEFTRFIEAERVEWEKVIRAGDIKEEVLK